MIESILLVAVIVWAVAGNMDEPLARFKSYGRSREEHLAFLTQYMRAHSITPAQLAEAYQQTPGIMPERKRGDILPKLMYGLGALFVFAGVSVYMTMFWDSMSSAMRIFSTLGVGMGLSVLSVFAMKEAKFEKALTPLILVAALMQSGGWFVFLHEMFPHGDDIRKAVLFCSGMMAFQQAMVFYSFRRTSLAFTAIAFTYGALQAALSIAGMRDEYISLLLGGSLIYTAHVLQATPQRNLSQLFFIFGCGWFNTGVYQVIERAADYKLAAIVTGMSLCSFALAMRASQKPKLAGLAFFLGSCIFYGGLFEEVIHTPLELLYFGVTISMMYVSAQLASRALLTTSVLAILGFIGYYTNEHFLNSAGWPIALMLMGVAFLAVGTMAVRIKRRYNM